MGTIAAYVIAMILDLRAVKKYTGTTFDMRTTYLVPGAASCLMGLGVVACYKLLYMVTDSNGISTLLSIAVAVIVYFALILLMKGISREEVEHLPKGDMLVRLLGRFLR